MDRINHVKIVSPDPASIDRFLREVLDVPEGWPLGVVPPPPAEVRSAAGTVDGELTVDSVHVYRAASGGGGFITGSTESRQLQILHGDTAHIWAVAIGTRHIERAYERCVERGIPCTEPAVAENEFFSGIRFFFAEVGGVMFEVMRKE
jgi:hypothetical protein